MFKSEHKLTVRSQNYLLDLLQRYVIVISMSCNLQAFQFGPNVLLDPTWDVTQLGRCSKAFRAVCHAPVHFPSPPTNGHRSVQGNYTRP